MDNRCIFCQAIIPEGFQVCQTCQNNSLIEMVKRKENEPTLLFGQDGPAAVNMDWEGK